MGGESALTVIVGISGGIAAYKAAALLREFERAGHSVYAVPTASALKFIGAPTLEALSHHHVTSSLFDDVEEVRHIQLAREADLVVIAPATADLLARLAAGRADDLLTATVLATTAPVVVAPAMHTEMWLNAATQANVATLVARGMTILGPGTGRLTGDDSGVGRLLEPAEIARRALDVLVANDLDGISIVVTAGGTHEPIDPVRYIGNRSTGKQGVAIARRAIARGATVTLIAANVEVPVPEDATTVHVETAEELERAVMAAAPSANAIIMAAAISDYRVEHPSETKLRKEDVGQHVALELAQNPDILRHLVDDVSVGATIIGFAAETAHGDQLIERGVEKVRRKGCDFLVVNEVGSTIGFGADTNSVAILDASGTVVAKTSGSKHDVADRILDVTLAHSRSN